MLITTLAFVALTALFVVLHLRGSAKTSAAGPAPGRACPRCGARLEPGVEICGACGAPLQAFELALAPVVEGDDEPGGVLHALVRADLCVGCGTCVDACPEAGAIRVVEHRALVTLDLCKGHARCVAACPVGAIAMSSGATGQRVEVPHVDVNFQTNVPGLYVAGELGGRGLIKNAVNEGKLAIEHVARRVREARGQAARPAAGAAGAFAGADGDVSGVYDVIIVGSGPAGLSAGLEALHSGLSYLVLEQGTLADTIARYPRRKVLFSEPLRVPLYGDLWVADGSKEELLRVWQDAIAKNGLEVRTQTCVESVEMRGGVFHVRAGDAEFRGRHVVLALGRRGTPRRLGVPGEERPNVFYDIIEMDVFAGQRMLVVGGGDSAVESALGLANQPGTRVTLCHRGADFARVKQRNRAKLEAAVAAGRVTVLLETEVAEIRPGSVALRVRGADQAVAADAVIIRIGGEAPYPFLERCGVRLVRRELARQEADPARLAATSAVAALVLAFTLAAGTAWAQVSPGPLANAHRELDGPTQCFQCHVKGGSRASMDPRCLDCHREIAWLRSEHSGLHARVNEPCAQCHPDHGGREFRLVEWSEGSPERFDHTRTGYALEGKHATLACRDCHQPKLRRSPAAQLAKRARPASSWVGLERECASCHEDPHHQQLGVDCARCHGFTAWQPAPGFDHARSRYPLTGAHARVECQKCHMAPGLELAHDAAGKALPQFRPLAHAECGDCHRDPHATRFGAACSRCHTTDAFRTINRAGFDHDRTRYPLRGAHAAVACERCHDPRRPGSDKPAFATCGGCHADAHAGQATLAGRAADCAACHDVKGYTPSTFTLARHQSSPYPLAGAHARAACRDCHVRRSAETAALGRAAVVMRPERGACVDCHVDPHDGRFAARAGGSLAAPATHAPKAAPGTTAARAADACLGCHTMEAYRPTTLDVAAHAQFAMALEGAHRAVPCAACHAELRAAPGTTTLLVDLAVASDGGAGGPRVRTLKFGESRKACRDCHDDPHGGQFAAGKSRGACEACHGLDAFAPASRFDHQRDAAFHLDGAHARIACASCHKTRRDAGGQAVIVYRPLGGRCTDCHRGAPSQEAG